MQVKKQYRNVEVRQEDQISMPYFYLDKIRFQCALYSILLRLKNFRFRYSVCTADLLIANFFAAPRTVVLFSNVFAELEGTLLNNTFHSPPSKQIQLTNLYAWMKGNSARGGMCRVCLLLSEGHLPRSPRKLTHTKSGNCPRRRLRRPKRKISFLGSPASVKCDLPSRFHVSAVKPQDGPLRDGSPKYEDDRERPACTSTAYFILTKNDRAQPSRSVMPCRYTCGLWLKTLKTAR